MYNDIIHLKNKTTSSFLTVRNFTWFFFLEFYHNVLYFMPEILLFVPLHSSL